MGSLDSHSFYVRQKKKELVLESHLIGERERESSENGFRFQ